MDATQMKYEFRLNYELDNDDAPGYNDREIYSLLTIAQKEIVNEYYYPYANKYLLGFDMSEKRKKDLAQLIRSIDLGQGAISSNQTGVHENGIYWTLPDDLYLTVQEEATISLNDCRYPSGRSIKAIMTEKDAINSGADVEYVFINDDGVSMAKATITETKKRVSVKPETFDRYNENIKNPFRNPYSGLVWRLEYSREDADNNIPSTNINKRHELITDGTYDIDTYHLHYIKKPRPIIGLTNSVFTIDGITSSTTTSYDCLLDEGVHNDIVKRAVLIASSITKPEEYQIKTIESNNVE